MAINGVGVQHKGQLFACMAVPDSVLGFKFNCGQCRSGDVSPTIGASCGVCGAVVRYVDDGPPRRFVKEPPAFVIQEPIDLEAIKARRAGTERVVRAGEEEGLKLSAWMKQDLADIEALLAEVVVFAPADCQLLCCLKCGSSSAGVHSMRECRDSLSQRVGAIAISLATQTSAHQNWRERAERRGEERDAALAEVKRLSECDCGKPLALGVCTGYCDNDE